MRRGFRKFKTNNIKEFLLGIIIGIVLLMFLVFGMNLIYESPEYSDYCDYQRLNLSENPQVYQECEELYDSVREVYSKNLFILSLIISLGIIISSVIFIEVNSVSGGLMFGSLMFLIFGTGSYWRYMNDLIRFIILGAVLGILIWLAYYLKSKKDKKVK